MADAAFRIRLFPREDLILLEVIERNNILLLFLSSSEFLAEALTGGKVRGRGGGGKQGAAVEKRQMGSREEFRK